MATFTVEITPDSSNGTIAHAVGKFSGGSSSYKRQRRMDVAVSGVGTFSALSLETSGGENTFSLDITGLTPGTTYNWSASLYYKNTSGGWVTAGSQYDKSGSFTTKSKTPTLPKTLVNGTAYDVKGGKCLVNGTVYNILKGRTLIGGTGYDITFPESLVMPVKGDLITMNLDGTDRQYRVLKIVDGTTVEVLGMWDDINNCAFGTNTRYSNSVLDTKLNTTWYNALSATAKAAIVPKNITQDYWYWATDIVYGSPYYSGFYGRTYPGTSAYIVSKNTVATPVDIGSRYVYAMSIQEVIDYLSDSNVLYQKDVMLMNANIWKAFWNKATNPGTTSIPILLRSIWSNEANRVWCADQSYGYLGAWYIGSGGIARPAFQIDLSKIDFIIN